MRTRDWLAGERLSFADLAAAAHLSAVDYLGDVPWNEDEAAKNWYARVKSRPSFRPLLADTLAGAAAVEDLRRPRLLNDRRDQGRARRAGARARLRRRRHHPARRGAGGQGTARALPRRRRAWRHGLDGDDRRAARRSARAVAGGALGHHARHELRAGPRSAGDPEGTRRAARSRSTRRARIITSSIKARLKQLARWLVANAGGDVKVFVDTAAVMEKPLAASAGSRLAGQAHQSGVARVWLVAVSRLDLHHARICRPTQRDRRQLRHLPRLPRHLPDRGVSGAVPARCAALHFVSHHRAQRADPARAARRDRQPHLRLRRLPRGLPVEQVRAGGPRGEARRARQRCARRSLPSWRGSTMRNSARCSPRPRSSAPAATASCAMC